MPDIYRKFQALLQNHPQILRIDLRKVERLAAGYAALLLRMKALAERQGTRLALANVPEQLHAIFRVYKLEDAFGVQETTEHMSVGKAGKEGAR
ncbi:MAG: STAS domain-containing protein [Planctomycetes bacterium]|nr:STAS domain-containing protein [Planctomycetota bacterium]